MSHTFSVDLQWKKDFQGEATPQGVTRSVPFAVPKEFGGPGGEWTPEHFLAASVSSCIAATFLSIAKQSKLGFASYESAASATMEKTGDGLRITRVEVRPRIVVRSDGDRERAERMIHKAESLCPISKSLKPEVACEPVVEVAGG